MFFENELIIYSKAFYSTSTVVQLFHVALAASPFLLEDDKSHTPFAETYLLL